MKKLKKHVLTFLQGKTLKEYGFSFMQTLKSSKTKQKFNSLQFHKT